MSSRGPPPGFPQPSPSTSSSPSYRPLANSTRQPLSTSPLRPSSLLSRPGSSLSSPVAAGSGIPPPGIFAANSSAPPNRTPLGGARNGSGGGRAGGYSYPGFGVLGAGSPVGSRPGSAGFGGRNRVASGSISGGGAGSAGNNGAGAAPHAREWSFFGVDIPISNISALHDPPAPSPTSLSSGDMGRRSTSSLASQELFSTSFGVDRWKLEILKPPQGGDKLSLYLSCQILDTAFSPDTIPTTLMFGIREPKEQIGKREGRDGWIWKIWENEWCFGTGNEYFECHSFPSFDELLRNPRIAQLDSFVLSVQISSPVPATVPQLQQTHHVPRDLLGGVQNLVDDRATGDVLIFVHERQDVPAYSRGEETDITASASTSLGGGYLDQETPMRFRKRSLFAHSAILRARSSYFEDMLTAGWAETRGDERKRNVVKIEDFDFVTVYWLIYYLYTNEITFQHTEDVRLLPPDELPLGWLGNPDAVSWDWFTLADLSEPLPTTSTHVPSGSLSDIAETDTPPEGSPSLSQSPSPTPGQSAKTQGKKRSVSGGAPAGSPGAGGSKRRPVTPDAEPSSPTRVSQAAGRISPLGGRISPTTLRGAGGGGRKFGHGGGGVEERERETKRPARGEEAEPHAHPATVVTPASALAIYRIAHRYLLPELASLALCHIISTLTLRTAFPLLLSTHLWPDLHSAIKDYALANYDAVCREPEFRRCYAEVGEGLWEHGGDVLLEFTLQLQPAWRGSLA